MDCKSEIGEGLIVNDSYDGVVVSIIVKNQNHQLNWWFDFDPIRV